MWPGDSPTKPFPGPMTSELHSKKHSWHCPAITLPKPDDLLWIVTDGAVRPPVIGATLYVTRETNFILPVSLVQNSEDHKSLGCLVRSRHFLLQLPPNISVLTSSSPTTTYSFSQIANPVSERSRNCAAASFPQAHVFLPFSQS